MSVLSPSQIFNPPAAPPTQVVPTQGASNQVPGTPSPTAGTDLQQQQQQEPKIPLDQFADLFAPPVDKDGKPIQNTPDAPMFSYDPQKMLEHARKMDFTKTVTPDMLQKVAAGGEDAVKAMVQIMNTVGQEAFANAAVAAAKLTEHGLTKAESKFADKLPNFFKQQNVTESLRQEKLLQHPAVAPMVDSVKQQIISKYPDASGEQIKEMVVTYFQNFAKSFVPTDESSSQRSIPGNRKQDNTDWSRFFS